MPSRHAAFHLAVDARRRSNSSPQRQRRDEPDDVINVIPRKEGPCKTRAALKQYVMHSLGCKGSEHLPDFMGASMGEQSICAHDGGVRRDVSLAHRHSARLKSSGNSILIPRCQLRVIDCDRAGAGDYCAHLATEHVDLSLGRSACQMNLRVCIRGNEAVDTASHLPGDEWPAVLSPKHPGAEKIASTGDVNIRVNDHACLDQRITAAQVRVIAGLSMDVGIAYCEIHL
jgi:hypothetical protein